MGIAVSSFLAMPLSSYSAKKVFAPFSRSSFCFLVVYDKKAEIPWKTPPFSKPKFSALYCSARWLPA
ncbi:Hypothetical protein Minf_1655 [Methylacidiphilum infernorum V4]|uniref:Uncharacterized protein n=1 Tax=Methylacidiphilum infernorum (isolate V4) TaxID=481448 RepID=B3DWP6_METI4|nr:Hypothetical protein Minf_1655 [Methylacidiphilum infernorum V4]